MATKPKRAAKAFGRSLSDFPNLSNVEKKLIEFCRLGQPLVLGNGTRPEKPTNANTIRSELIRFLLLSGDEQNPVNESGVQIKGAWIQGNLNLSSCRCQHALKVLSSTISGELIMVECILPTLKLSGTSTMGIKADGAIVDGNIFLDEGFLATGEVRLLGAKVAGDIGCRNGSFLSKDGDALSADRVIVKGSMFLDHGFRAGGRVRLNGAQISVNLECRGGSFGSTAVSCLSLDGAIIEGALILDSASTTVIEIIYADAKINSLMDSPSSSTKHILDGFEYEKISGDSRTDAFSRLAWLDKQPRDHLYENFKPQPWEQLIKVLRTMGHIEDADKVAIAKQEQLYRAGQITGFNKIWHKLYGLLAGYGYRPTRTMIAMIFVWFFAGLCYQGAADFGLVGPTSAVIQSNKSIADICNAPNTIRETQWTVCKELPQTYTTFSPYLYSLDLILPLVDLQQDRDWSPIVMEPDARTIIWSGAGIRAVMWFEILFGWMASLLLVAVLGNLVKKD